MTRKRRMKMKKTASNTRFKALATPMKMIEAFTEVFYGSKQKLESTKLECYGIEF
jgi:hypothetical protein